MSVRIVWKKGRQNRVAEIAFVVVPDIDDCLLLRKELGKHLVAAPLKWLKLQNFEGDRVDLSKNQSRFLSNELRVLVSDSGGEALHQPVILRSSLIERLLVALEDGERCSKVGLHRLCIHIQRVRRLVSNVEVRPHLTFKLCI